MEVEVVVEIPRGSRNKYEMDHHSGAIWLDRMLFTATQYPADYGFVADTLGEDGDPLDALVLVEEATFPGCHINARPVAAFLMQDEAGRDAKVLCVPASDNRWDEITGPRLTSAAACSTRSATSSRSTRPWSPTSRLTSRAGWPGPAETLVVGARQRLTGTS